VGSPHARARVFPLLAGGLIGCGGGAPLLHPAHALPPGIVSMGGGMSGQVALRQSPTAPNGARLQKVAVAPGIAPWVAGRAGLAGSNEAGLTYTARAVRLDARHAFDLEGPAISVGVGGSLVFPQRPGRGDDETRVRGGGFDVPILFGVRSRSDLYAIWIGPRGGLEFLGGSVLGDTVDPSTGSQFVDISVRHFQIGGVAGLRAGFRHLHVVVELDGAYHHAEGTFGKTPVSVDQVTLTPAGALVVTF